MQNPVSPPSAHLLESYTHNPVFTHKVQQLDLQYQILFPVLGDGNCYYRAVIWAIALKNTENALEIIRKSRAQITLDPICWEDFADDLENFLLEMKDKENKSEFLLSKIEEIDKPSVVYLRMITAQYLRTNMEQFEPVVLGLGSGTNSLDAFVRAEVEPLDKEADFPQCLALASALGIHVRVEYLDNNPGDIRHIDFPECMTSPDIYLLYRPGHYDLLIPK